MAYAATRLKSNKGGVKNHKMKMQDNCSSYRFRIRDYYFLNRNKIDVEYS